MTMSYWQQQADRAPPDLLPLLRELGDLKRIRSANRAGSIAERLFATAWSHIVAGEDDSIVAFKIVSDSLTAVRIGDLDAQALAAAGVPLIEISRIRRIAAQAVASLLDPSLRLRLTDDPLLGAKEATVPAFVSRLAAQPRAGATCPGRGRLILEPSENHAEHCALVAIYGVLLAPAWDARPETVFLAGLAHHLHNALLPDAGYAGEVSLGEWLRPAMVNATRLALQELPPVVRTKVETACQILPNADSPEGRAFHAADTLDRILQLEHHLRAATTNMDFVLQEMELVHAGPVKPFQDAILAHMGLTA